jgi:hypothetical protein
MARLFLLVWFALAPTGAMAQLVSGGGGPGSDWWARGVSAIALVVSLATFGFGRWDKWREKKAAELARLPVVEIVLEPHTAPHQWLVRFSFQNRADVIDIDEIKVLRPAGAALKRSAYPTAPDGSRRAIPSSGPWGTSIFKLSRLHSESNKGFEDHFLKLEQTHEQTTGLTAKFLLKLSFVDNRNTRQTLIRTAKF